MRFLAIVMLAALSNFAHANWTKVLTTESDTDIYVDHKTVSKSGTNVKMWIMEDRKSAGSFAGKTFMSAKLEYEYDCKDRQRRVLQSSLYSGQKAGGNNVQTGTKTGPWRPITEGRVNEALWKIACSKK